MHNEFSGGLECQEITSEPSKAPPCSFKRTKDVPEKGGLEMKSAGEGVREMLCEEGGVCEGEGREESYLRALEGATLLL